jgi:hypothetical protein
VGHAFELPPNSPHRFLARSPWKADQNAAPVSLVAGQQHAFTLKPFEVLTLEALPTEP